MLHVNTVAELGSLRDLFRASPVLGAHVRHFSFTWDMAGELTGRYEEGAGREIDYEPGDSLIDLDFADRVKRVAGRPPKACHPRSSSDDTTIKRKATKSHCRIGEKDRMV